MAKKHLSSGASINRNTDWITPWFFVYYFGAMFAARLIAGWFLLVFGVFPVAYAWTLTHCLHSVLTFYPLHWSKGNVDGVQSDMDPGRWDNQTWWEQIDDGRQWTTNRKLFMLAPLFSFLLASYATDWSPNPLMLNFVFLLLALIPKSDMMHEVRIGGVNK